MRVADIRGAAVMGACCLITGLSGALAPMAALAQTARAFDPARPVTIVIPAAAGGASELEIRMYTQKYTDSTGQQVLFDYRPGAGSTIGNAFVAKAPPDGHTLMMATSSFTIAPSVYKNLEFNPRDFSAVTLLSKRPYLLVVHPSVPVKNVTEYIAYVKANPDRLNFATTGAGGAIHLAGAWLHHAAGIPMTYIHYKGAAQIYPDLTSGRVQLTLGQPQSAGPGVKAGKLRLIGVTTTERLRLFPDAPTAAEQGAKGYDYSGWLGIVGTPGIPVATLNRISAELAKATRAPDLIQKLAEEGSVLVGNTPEQFRQHILREIDNWRTVIQAVNIRLEE